MNLSRRCLRQIGNNISRFNLRVLSPYPNSFRNVSNIDNSISCPKYESRPLQNPICPKPFWVLNKYFHSAQNIDLKDSGSDVDSDESEEDGTMNEFLSRFVWILRGKLSEVYPDCDKNTINDMLLIIVAKVVSEMDKGSLEQMIGAAAVTPSNDFSEDLWKTVSEVSSMVLDDMEKARKKEKMKTFLHDSEVKEMYKFAGQIGIRGDMLRELRFKWAREKLEESEFYESLELFREEESQALESKKSDTVGEETVETDIKMTEEKKDTVISLPKRHGKIKYKIYGLDLSEPRWAQMADNIHETGEVIWPQEAKLISGKCKVVTEKILMLQETDDLSPILAEWKELLKPRRIDWINLLDRLKERNMHLYYKVAEHVLAEESFQTNIRDYSVLIDAHTKEGRFEDSERLLKRMNEDGFIPDILTLNIMVHIYSKAGKLDKAKEAFERLGANGFIPDIMIYNSMIMAYVNSGKPSMGETLIRQMEARDMKPSEDIYMALLRSFAQVGDVNAAQRIASNMHFSGFQPTLESCTLLVETYARAGHPDQARNHFDEMISTGLKPDDRCIASMIAAYESKNLLDKALNLLLQLEKDGFQLGVATYSVLVYWFCQLQLIDEAEELLGKITEQHEAPPLKVHVGLCDMYARAGNEKKALQALGVVEANKDKLGKEEFERLIKSLMMGGFAQDAKRVQGWMEGLGITPSDNFRVFYGISDLQSRHETTKQPIR